MHHSSIYGELHSVMHMMDGTKKVIIFHFILYSFISKHKAVKYMMIWNICYTLCTSSHPNSFFVTFLCLFAKRLSTNYVF